MKKPKKTKEERADYKRQYYLANKEKIYARRKELNKEREEEERKNEPYIRLLEYKE